MAIDLDAEEEEFMRASGTKLTRNELMEFVDGIEDGIKTFDFEPCGYLCKGNNSNGFCSVYNDPRRPKACSAYEVGGPECEKQRRKERSA